MTESTAVRPDATDPTFATPYIDIDEMRAEPIRHRYLHGGFEGTATRFSFYLPPAELYEGRFFQHFTPAPDSENLGPTLSGGFNKIAFALSSGGYFVETNGGGQQGGPFDTDPTIGAFRANAAAAEFSRTVAATMYGDHRPFGYAYGGSGGGFRTMGAAENTTGVWDGFVPYVIGSPMAMPNVFSVRMHAQRILRDKFDSIVDALEPGGSGDMYAGLSDEERDALLEVTRMGFPPRSWFAHRTMGMHGFAALYPGMRAIDPGYFTDFWTLPGYLGSHPTASLLRERVDYLCEVREVLSEGELIERGILSDTAQLTGGVDDSWVRAGTPAGAPLAIRLSVPPGRTVMGADLFVQSGAAAGERIGLQSISDDVAWLGPHDFEVLAKVRPGDSVLVDNGGFLAGQTYHRHQVPGRDYAAWDQFRGADGTPLYPQRPVLLGPIFAAGASGTIQTGKFDGKMIVVASLLDREAFPWQADWYRARVAENLGDRVDEQFRLWYTDNAVHGDDPHQENPTHTVSYVGIVHQALRDVAAWVEKGIAPPASTHYEVRDGQVEVPREADVRGGVQPTLQLTSHGAPSAHIGVGETVIARADARVPRSVGTVFAIEWDDDGSGSFAVRDEVAAADELSVTRSFRFDSAGTYFVVARVVGQRDGSADDLFTRTLNLARLRVVVG